MANAKRTALDIIGMACAACSNRIEKELNKLDDINAQVNLTAEKATTEYNPDQHDVQEFISTIQYLGYGVVVETVELDITGMTCAACSSRTEKVLNKMDGVQSAAVNLTAEQAKVDYYPEETDADKLVTRVQKLGYDTSIKDSSKDQTSCKAGALQHKLIELIISTVLSLPLLVLMFVHLFNMHILALFTNPWLQLILATPVQFIIEWQFYVGVYENLRNDGANMNILVAVGASAAYFCSIYEMVRWLNGSTTQPHLYFETNAVLITLILSGKYLEARTKSQTTNALGELLNLQARETRILKDGNEVMIPLNEIHVGGTLTVKPGERISVDGRIIKGITAIDESMLTGEPIPVEKNVDDTVIGSAMDKNGTITMTATEVDGDTALANIIKVVEEAQSSKAPIQRLVDIISGYFAPIIVDITLLTSIVWTTLVTPGTFEPALVASISVLVTACPCALGLATPTSIMAGTGRTTENGTLFKGDEFVERTHQVDTIILGKTGTITNGHPVVTDYHGGDQTLQLLATVEKDSEHPLAEAIVNYAKEKQLILTETATLKTVPGHGIEATTDHHRILVGSHKLMADNDTSLPRHISDDLTHYERDGKTAMLITANYSLTGIIVVIDTVKDHTKDVIRQLHDMGIEVTMLTGNNKDTTQATARQVDTDTIIANILPEEEVAQVAKLQQQGKKVTVVGDGVNGAPALIKADIDIAISTGTEVAIEAADTTILGGDLMLIPKAIYASEAAIRNTHQDLFWVFGYNIAGILMAVLGLLVPQVAGAAIALDSVSVVTNALRLKKIRLEPRRKDTQIPQQ